MHVSTIAEPLEGGVSDASDQAVDSVMHAVLSIGRLMRQRDVGDQLEPAIFWLLKNLSAGSLRVTELATCTHLDASTVSRHVSQMERAGLIARTPDPDDRRAQRVGLSEQGRAQLQATMDRRRARLARSLDGWDTDDIHDLDRLLGRFAASIENLTLDLEHA